VRTVKVALEADVAGYVGGVKEADKATEKLDRDVEALDRDLNKLPADAAKAGAALAVMGEEAKKTGRDVDDMGKKTSTSADDTSKLDKRIAELKTSVKDLATEFDKSGDPALLKKFRSDSSELAGLKKMRKEVSGFSDEVKSLTENMDMFSFETPGVGAAGLGIYGAVLGNPEAFKAAWTSATGTVKQELVDAGDAFQGPAMDAIKSVGPTIAGWHLDQALAPAAKYVPELVHGIEGFSTGVERGAADLVAKAGPAVTELSAGLSKLGDAAGHALSSIADGAEGGADALHDMFTAVSYLIEGFGKVVEGAEKAYSFVHDHPIASAVGSFGLSIPISLLEDVDNKTGHLQQTELGARLEAEKLGHAFDDQGEDLTKLAQQLDATTLTADKLSEMMSLKVLNTTMELDRATLSWDQSLLSLGDALKANGRSLDEHSAKGVANREAILSVVQANISAYRANVDAGMGADQASAAYDANTRALEKQLRQAGFNQAAIDGLIGKYRSVPNKVSTDIAMNGLTESINRMTALIAYLNHVDGYQAYASVTITEQYKANRQSVYDQQVPKFHAAGGKLDPGWNVVGEEGIELIDNRSGVQRVYPTAQSRSMMAAGAAWGGQAASPTTIALTLAAAPGADTAVGSFVNGLIRNGYVVVKASEVRAGV
jgi:hypothetical protein